MDVIRTVLGDYSPAGDAKVVVEPSAASVPGKGSVLHSRGPSDGDESCILANVLKERDELEIELLERYAELRHASQVFSRELEKRDKEIKRLQARISASNTRK